MFFLRFFRLQPSSCPRFTFTISRNAGVRWIVRSQPDPVPKMPRDRICHHIATKSNRPYLLWCWRLLGCRKFAISMKANAWHQMCLNDMIAPIVMDESEDGMLSVLWWVELKSEFSILFPEQIIVRSTKHPEWIQTVTFVLFNLPIKIYCNPLEEAHFCASDFQVRTFL